MPELQLHFCSRLLLSPARKTQLKKNRCQLDTPICPVGRVGARKADNATRESSLCRSKYVFTLIVVVFALHTISM